MIKLQSIAGQRKLYYNACHNKEDIMTYKTSGVCSKSIDYEIVEPLLSVSELTMYMQIKK